MRRRIFALDFGWLEVQKAYRGEPDSRIAFCDVVGNSCPMLVCPECGETEPAATFCPRDGSALLDRGQDDLLGGLVGSYRVARLVGQGSMGSVYVGVNSQIGSRVAIKVISTEDLHDTARVERFFAEARIVNLIREEHIVNVLDLGRLGDGRPYIMMEYVEGMTLSALMNRPEGIGPRQLIDLGLQILRALAAAHAKEVVHRDLKPDNVVVTPRGRAKVLDFGIAKLRHQGLTALGLTATGAVLGTPYYMSPEAALARRVDARSDLYSFGVILYKGLCGRLPFTGDSMYSVLQQQVERAPAPLRTYRPELPDALDSIVLRTLAKDPAERPQSAMELHTLLVEAQRRLPGAPSVPFDACPTPPTEPDVPAISQTPGDAFWATNTGSSFPPAAPPAMTNTGSSPPLGTQAATELWAAPHVASSPAPGPARALALSPEASGSSKRAKWLAASVLVVVFMALGALLAAAIAWRQRSTSLSETRHTTSSFATPVR